MKIKTIVTSIVRRTLRIKIYDCDDTNPLSITKQQLIAMIKESYQRGYNSGVTDTMERLL